MKIHNFCFLCQAKEIFTPISICELKGKEYVLYNDKYVLNKKNKSFINYIQQFGVDVSLNILENYTSNVFESSKISYYVTIFNIMYKQYYTYQADSSGMFQDKQKYYFLFLDNIIIFGNKTIPISALGLARLYNVQMWGIVNTVLDRNILPDFFSRIHPNFSVVFFSENPKSLINFVNNLITLYKIYTKKE